jgi:hypothetical protein
MLHIFHKESIMGAASGKQTKSKEGRSGDRKLASRAGRNAKSGGAPKKQAVKSQKK